MYPIFYLLKGDYIGPGLSLKSFLHLLPRKELEGPKSGTSSRSSSSSSSLLGNFGGEIGIEGKYNGNYYLGFAYAPSP